MSLTLKSTICQADNTRSERVLNIIVLPNCSLQCVTDLLEKLNSPVLKLVKVEVDPDSQTQFPSLRTSEYPIHRSCPPPNPKNIHLVETCFLSTMWWCHKTTLRSYEETNCQCFRLIHWQSKLIDDRLTPPSVLEILSPHFPKFQGFKV